MNYCRNEYTLDLLQQMYNILVLTKQIYFIIRLAEMPIFAFYNVVTLYNFLLNDILNSCYFPHFNVSFFQRVISEISEVINGNIYLFTVCFLLYVCYFIFLILVCHILNSQIRYDSLLIIVIIPNYYYYSCYFILYELLLIN